jgi:hypothetical protein
LPEMLVKSTGKEKPRPPVGKEQAPPEGALPPEALRRLRGPPLEGVLPPEALRRLRGPPPEALCRLRRPPPKGAAV